jgi:hypothetical protein
MPECGVDHRDEAPCRNQFGLALQSQRLDCLSFHCRPHQGVRIRAEQDPARRGRRLEASRHVDRVSGNNPLPDAGIPGHHLAGVQSHPPLDGDALLRPDLGVQAGQPVTDLDRRATCTQRVVLVDRGHSEDGHHGIADELFDDPTMKFDQLAHHIEVAGHEVPQRLGVDPFPQRGG